MRPTRCEMVVAAIFIGSCCQQNCKMRWFPSAKNLRGHCNDKNCFYLHWHRILYNAQLFCCACPSTHPLPPKCFFIAISTNVPWRTCLFWSVIDHSCILISMDRMWPWVLCFWRAKPVKHRGPSQIWSPRSIFYISVTSIQTKSHRY